jgi:hypothetical protein
MEKKMKAIYFTPLAFLPLTAVFGMLLFTQWDQADSAERRADSAERRATGWEEVARKQSAAMENLMAADKQLKSATDRLQIACAAR